MNPTVVEMHRDRPLLLTISPASPPAACGAGVAPSRYSQTGAYLGSVALKPEQLAQGQYFRFQLPRIVGDGILVAQRLSGETTTFLLLRDGDATLVSELPDLGLTFDDGTFLDGFSGEGQKLTRVDPCTGEPTEVPWIPTPAGDTFRLEPRGDRLAVNTRTHRIRPDTQMASWITERTFQ